MERLQGCTPIDGSSTVRPVRSRGAAIIEAVIALPVLLVIILAIVQFGLIYEAKSTLNHAALQAARAGSVANAQVSSIRLGLARGLLPLYSPDSSLQAVARTLSDIHADVITDARIRILNPTREAFDDFGETVDGQRELPNDRLSARSTALGTRSGVNIQDANLLRVEITYGHELDVPLVNWFLTRVLLAASNVGAARWDAFEQQLLRRTRLPIVATATVRMQSPARLNDAIVSLSDLPNLARVPANDRPADDPDDGDEAPDDEEQGTSGEDTEDEGRSLADGAFGFHGDHAEDPQGSGPNPANPESGSETGSDGSTSNGGSPAMCSTPSSNDAAGNIDSTQGGTSPIASGSSPLLDPFGNSSAAALPSNTLPGLAVGNPIHVATGNKYQAETDLETLPGHLALSFSRHYNSEAANHVGVLGAGWRHSFDARVLTDSDAPDSLHVVQADGRKLHFVRSSDDPQGPLFVGTRLHDGTLLPVAVGYQWRWMDGRLLSFDLTGRLTAIQRHGHRVELTYRNGRLDRVIDSQQRSLRFHYYANGRLARITGPEGFWTRYRYDNRGNLAEALYADGSARTYHYEAAGLPHHLTRIVAHGPVIREFGQRVASFEVASWTYDARGRTVSSSHPGDAGRVSLQYGDRFTEVEDAFGRITRYEYEWEDGIARITAIRGPGCSPCGAGDVRYAYGPGFTITEIARAHEPSYLYSYDARGRLRETRRVDLSSQQQWLSRFEYDGDGGIPRLIEQPSVRPNHVLSTQIEFDRTGNPRSIAQLGYKPTSDQGFVPITRTVRFRFDAHARLREFDGPRSDIQDITHLSYDDLGRLTSARTPAGTEIHIEKYDGAGRARVLARGSRRLTIDYDVMGRVRSVRRSGEPRPTRYEYDGTGRLKAIVDNAGRTRHLRYDRANRLSVLGSDAGIEERLLLAPDDLPVKSMLRLSNGEVLRKLHFVYDAHRRLIEARDGSGAPLQQLRYLDSDSRPDLMIDPLGTETALTYDALGRLHEVRAADGGTTHLERDAYQRVLSVSSPNGALTRYAYDDFGRRVLEVSADRGDIEYQHDAADNLTVRTNANGLVTRYEYDAANRLVRIARADAVTQLRYHDGRLTAIDSSGWSERFRYSDAGRLVAHTRTIDGHRFTTLFEHDREGRLASKRLPSGERLLFTYNSRGQLIGISTRRLFGSARLIGTDDPNSSSPPLNDAMLGDIRLGNGLTTRTRLDLESARIGYRATDGVLRFKYEHDAANRVIAIDRSGDRMTYRYDALGRLTSALSAEEHAQYSYDVNGNRTLLEQRKGSVVEAQRLSYEQRSNRLLSVTKTAPTGSTERYEYDRAGNPIRVGAWKYDYDASGRLSKVYRNGVLRAEYTYNPHGERIRKDVYEDGKRNRTYFLYENHKLVAEANERGRITRTYVYLGHHPVVMMQRGTAYWIHTDRLGKAEAITDENQTIVWQAKYAPFGSARVNPLRDSRGNAITFNLRLPGQYFDAESGLHQNILRTYDPGTGRYRESDPIGLRGGLNSFAYVSSNPLSFIDPLGTYQEDIHFYMTFFLGVTAGLSAEDARFIALATQFVDDNRYTQPIDARNVYTIIHSMFVNQRQLKLYHFVLSDDDGETLAQYDNDDYSSPRSEQLERMLGYALEAPSLNPGICLTPDAAYLTQLQFFGEYLHAFEDTFAHRDRYDRPYDAIFRLGNNEYGLGHGLDLSHPDYTYNHNTLLNGNWTSNEARTLQMEREVWSMMLSYFGDQSRAASWEQLEPILREFNAIAENSLHVESEGWAKSDKAKVLSRTLHELGYGGVSSYSEPEARANRKNAFQHLDRSAYDYAILETED